MMNTKAMEIITCTILEEMVRQHRIAAQLDFVLEDIENQFVGLPKYDKELIEGKRAYRTNYLGFMGVEMTESEEKMWEKLQYLVSLEDL